MVGKTVSASGADGDWWAIESMPEGLIDSPLDFIFAEHHRQRQAALILTMIADGDFNKTGVTRLIDFLESDFALHIMDEELSFFPTLKSRCVPEDNIEALITRLVEEHRKDESVSEEVLTILKTSVLAEKMSEDEARCLRAFAEHIRQHLAVENAVLLPIARVRLDEAELAFLSKEMKRRRMPH